MSRTRTGPPQARPSRGQPCPCGSGKKYKDCCALKIERRRRIVRRSRKILKWMGAIGAVFLLGYVAYRLGGGQRIGQYTEADLTMVNFSGLTERQRETVLKQANEARCSCGCGMTLARCVATDLSCPRRSTNIARIQAIVAQASSLE